MIRAILLLTILSLTIFASTKKIDDWDYNSTVPRLKKNVNVKSISPMAMPMSAPMMKMSARSLGLAVGGAKDTNNFFDNLKNDYLPKLDSITYEGVFYQHYFDTGKNTKCDELFCPSYSTAVQKNLFTDKREYFLSVGLNSNLDSSKFKRKKLNIVVVLDISGSMSSPFNSYYYDKNHKRHNIEDRKSKMQIANKSIVAMMKHLKDVDSFGVVLFDNQAYKAKPLRSVASTDMEAIKKHILELKPRGGTNWKAGYDAGIKLFDSLDNAKKDPSIYENRIIFLTDAMPNSGELSENGLFGMVDKASKKGIYTSFVGIGVDFNTDLVEKVSKTKGANYVAVHSLKEFRKRLDDEFDYMVTPLVFDVKLSLESNFYELDGVYGSPDANKATNTLLYINTLFPSASKDEKVKGGIVLVKLKKLNNGDDIKLKVSYKTRDGKSYENTQKVVLKDDLHFDNSGIKKAILLSEYVTLIKNWLIDMRGACNDEVSSAIPQPIPLYKRCLNYPPEHPNYQKVKTWERKSCSLRVSDGYRKLFSIFSRKYVTFMKDLKDDSLKKEFKVLKKLSTSTKVIKGKKDDWELN